MITANTLLYQNPDSLSFRTDAKFYFIKRC